VVPGGRYVANMLAQETGAGERCAPEARSERMRRLSAVVAEAPDSGVALIFAVGTEASDSGVALIFVAVSGIAAPAPRARFRRE
jgi:hypothetical protein